MKRGLCIILLACMLLTACAGKGKTKTEPVPHKNIYSKDECTVNYESAISKCAGAPGTGIEHIDLWMMIWNIYTRKKSGLMRTGI